MCPFIHLQFSNPRLLLLSGPSGTLQELRPGSTAAVSQSEGLKSELPRTLLDDSLGGVLFVLDLQATKLSSDPTGILLTGPASDNGNSLIPNHDAMKMAEYITVCGPFIPLPAAYHPTYHKPRTLVVLIRSFLSLSGDTWIGLFLLFPSVWIHFVSGPPPPCSDPPLGALLGLTFMVLRDHVVPVM